MSDYRAAIFNYDVDTAVREYMVEHDASLSDAREAVLKDMDQAEWDALEKEMM